MTSFRTTAMTAAGAALAVALSVGAASAALTFDTFDCDGDGMSDFVGGGCIQRPLTAYSIGVLFDAVDGTGGGLTEWAFQINKRDISEIQIPAANWDFVFGALVTPGSVASKSDFIIRMSYLPNAVLSHGDVIGSLQFTTGAVLTRAPLDALADIAMVSYEGGVNATTMVNPATGAVGAISPFEVQMVPLPASALLVLGGLGALAGARARRRA